MTKYFFNLENECITDVKFMALNKLCVNFCLQLDG